MLKKIKFKIDGIHCKSCKVLIETEIDILRGIKEVSVDHQTGMCEIEFDDEKISKNKIFKEIEKLNYKVIVENQKNEESSEEIVDIRWMIKFFLIPLGVLALIGLYSIIKNFGGFELMSKLNEESLGYGIILLIGLLSGFHCVGMCGGLVVAYSADCLKKGSKKSTKPHFEYNLGRLISYTLIGAILGGLGSFFGINPSFTGMVMVIASIFMVLMGISFLGNYPILEKIKLRTPQFIARYLYNQKHESKSKGPLVIGLLNGFMPCGPLQAMQLYALTTGSVTKGAAAMFIYALGTVPMMFGFGALISSIGKKYIHRIIKFSGVLIIILGLVMLNRGLASFGYNIDIGKKENKISKEYIVGGDTQEYQIVRMEVGYLGYSPNVLHVKKDIPVKWVINVKEITQCTKAIMIESLGIKRDLVLGENIIEFMPTEAGEIKFSCWMRMVWGKFIVTENNYKPTKQELKEQINDLPQGGGCGSPEGDCGCNGSVAE